MAAYFYNSQITLERSVVSATLPDAAHGLPGTGVQLIQDQDMPTGLTIESCLIARNRGVGVLLEGAWGKIRRSAINETGKEEAHGEFGDGIVVGAQRGKLDLADSLVYGSARAGLLFVAATGSVHGSTFKNGVFAIDLEEGATPEIGDDNVYLENVENKVTFGRNLAASKAPAGLGGD
jgi:hypothetical protein